MIDWLTDSLTCLDGWKHCLPCWAAEDVDDEDDVVLPAAAAVVRADFADFLVRRVADRVADDGADDDGDVEQEENCDGSADVADGGRDDAEVEAAYVSASDARDIPERLWKDQRLTNPSPTRTMPQTKLAMRLGCFQNMRQYKQGICPGIHI